MKTPPFEKIEKLWNLDQSHFLIRKLVNFVYSAKRKDQDVIVRFTPSSKRSKEDLRVELDWIYFLNKSGASVATSIKSANGNDLEEVQGKDELYYVAVFNKAPGKFPSVRDLNEEFFLEWGRKMGQFHRLTKEYRPPFQRHDWLKQGWEVLHDYDEKKENIKPYKTLKTLSQKFLFLPQDVDSYGLIHADLHIGNFHIKEKKLIVFDFDDCCYHWFAFDIAIAMIHFFHDIETKKIPVSPEKFKSFFMKGYLKENDLSSFWLEKIPEFMTFRAALLYCWGRTYLKASSLSSKAREDLESWVRWMGQYVNEEEV